MTYLFYDIETTGLNRAFDQILRFAAIRTDQRLREIDRHLIKVRLRDDIIPAPAAVTTHRISIEEARAEGMPEVEAIREIHRLVNEPGTISVGYNSLGFDDHFLRFSFYRNLLSPYTHQWKDDCGRMDVYPMTVVYCLQEHKALEWPTDNGSATLRLEHLSASNSLTDGRAHSAMADTEATVELARRLAQDRTLWNQLHDHFDKDLDQGRFKQLPTVSIGGASYPAGLLVGGMYGEEKRYQRPVLGLGRHRTYRKQTRWLVLDSPDLQEVTAESIAETAEIEHKTFGVPDFLYSSEDESVARLSSERRELANANIVRMKKNPALLEAIADHYLNYTYPDRPDVDVDAALYLSEFRSPDQERQCRLFHEEEALERKIAMIDRFERKDLWQLARRLVIRNYSDAQLPDELDGYRRKYMQQIAPAQEEDALLDYRELARRTPGTVLEVMTDMRDKKTLDREQHELLDGMEAYIKQRFSRGNS